MPTFHFQIDASVQVEAQDADAAALKLEEMLDAEEPLVLHSAAFSLMRTNERGRPVHQRRYTPDEFARMVRAHLTGRLDTIDDPLEEPTQPSPAGKPDRPASRLDDEGPAATQNEGRVP